MSDVLYRLTEADAEAVLGRPLKPGEASSIRKTLEGLNEYAVELIQNHAEAEAEAES